MTKSTGAELPWIVEAYSERSFARLHREAARWPILLEVLPFHLLCRPDAGLPNRITDVI